MRLFGTDRHRGSRLPHRKLPSGAVLQDIGTKQFQAVGFVQMSIRFRNSNGGRIKIEGQNPAGSESESRDGQNPGPGARIEEFPIARFRRDIG